MVKAVVEDTPPFALIMPDPSNVVVFMPPFAVNNPECVDVPARVMVDPALLILTFVVADIVPMFILLLAVRISMYKLLLKFCNIASFPVAYSTDERTPPALCLDPNHKPACV